jgi:probable phosphoglycerate mutase
MAKEYRQARFSLPPGACHVIVVRHGESQPLARGELQPLVEGQGDPPLDPRGHEQAAQVAERLGSHPIAAIYVSTLQRTSQTAAPLAEVLGLTPIVEPDLREVHLGEWEGGLYRVRQDENHPEWQRVQVEQSWDVIPGAEQSVDLAARLKRVVGRIASAHPDQRVCLFAHGGVIGMMSALATGGRMWAFAESDNGSITHLIVHGDLWKLRRFNDTCHLGRDLDVLSDEQP